jgi:hypothetical protein
LNIRAIFGAAALALVSACTPSPSGDGDVLLPKLPPLPPGVEDFRHTALLVGRPVVHNGCVKVQAPEGGLHTVLWHPETELEERGGTLVLRNGISGATYAFGEELRGGGGEMPVESVAKQFPEVAARCGPPYRSGYLPLRKRPAGQKPRMPPPGPEPGPEANP